MASIPELSYMWRARVAPRFFPAHYLSATIWDQGVRVAQGVVTDLSESGASLVTDRMIPCSPSVHLKLAQQEAHFIETRARIVWDVQEMDMDLVQAVLGARLGICFLDVSAFQRRKIKQLLVPCEWEVASACRYDGNGHDIDIGNGSANGNGKRFDLLIDPNIESLFSPDFVGREKSPPRQRVELLRC